MSVSAKNVSKFFGRTAALRAVSLEVGAGEIVHLAGGNGAGKTTLLRILAGSLRPDKGEVVSSGRRSAAVEDLGLYPALTLRENFDLFQAALGGSGDGKPLVSRLGLETSLDKELRHCSSGIARRAALVRVLLGEPKIILLDEPLANLDADSKASICALLGEVAARGAAIVLSSHEPVAAGRTVTLREGSVSA